MFGAAFGEQGQGLISRKEINLACAKEKLKLLRGSQICIPIIYVPSVTCRFTRSAALHRTKAKKIFQLPFRFSQRPDLSIQFAPSALPVLSQCPNARISLSKSLFQSTVSLPSFPHLLPSFPPPPLLIKSSPTSSSPLQSASAYPSSVHPPSPPSLPSYPLSSSPNVHTTRASTAIPW